MNITETGLIHFMEENICVPNVCFTILMLASMYECDTILFQIKTIFISSCQLDLNRKLFNSTRVHHNHNHHYGCLQ